MKLRRLTLWLVLFSSFGLLDSSAQSKKKLEWPAITNQTKPWTRWWWLGNVGEPRDFTVEMEKYAKAGLGGLEITPIYGVKGYEQKFVNYLSPQWMKKLGHTLKEAERLGLGIDMATGTGWPFGGPWIGDDEACKNFVTKTWKLKTGERLSELVTFIQKPLVRANGKRYDIKEIKYPVSANENLQALSLDQVRYERSLPLQVLMAYSHEGKVIELTQKVNAKGELDWQAPAGEWTLYALFQGWHGKMVERAGPGGEGNVIDHFSKPALDVYLKKFDQAFAGQDLRYLRGFFNDSYEVDDAAGEADFTPRLFEEFLRRRGYDLREHLPALLGQDSADHNRRVLCDYRETISELLLDQFTHPWHEWAAQKGKITRNQSHGSPANILDLYATNDIPETEGQEILRMKFASSAAHVTGKQLVSAEAATWLNEHTLATLGDVKTAVDNFFLGGVNHIVYHGTPFSPEQEAWPGLLFYAAVHFGPSNPYWQDFSTLNAYVTRVQSFLQQGKSDNELLLYYPIHDSWAEPGKERLQHYGGGIESGLGLSAGKTLLESGYSFDMISDRQLNQVQAEKNHLRTPSQQYKAIVLPETKTIPLSTWNKLMDLAAAGATVIILGELPKDVPGWQRADERRAQLFASQAKLQFVAKAESGFASIGEGEIWQGTDLVRILASAGIQADEIQKRGLNVIRRRNKDGMTYFLVNRGKQTFEGWLPVQYAGSSVAIFDPLTGRKGKSLQRASNADTKEVYLQLAPGASLILCGFDDQFEAEPFEFHTATNQPQVLSGKWDIQFLNGGPALPAPFHTEVLESWTKFGRASDEVFSGTAKYSLSFARPLETAQTYKLDLGKVAESVRVSLNGLRLGTLINAPFELLVPVQLLKDQNLLELEVTNLMTNRVIDLDKRGVEWKRFYNVNLAAKRKENADAKNVFSAAHWEARPSGLLGPVTITAVRVINFQRGNGNTAVR